MNPEITRLNGAAQPQPNAVVVVTALPESKAVSALRLPPHSKGLRQPLDSGGKAVANTPQANKK
jgi:hypothetical protein